MEEEKEEEEYEKLKEGRRKKMRMTRGRRRRTRRSWGSRRWSSHVEVSLKTKKKKWSGGKKEEKFVQGCPETNEEEIRGDCGGREGEGGRRKSQKGGGRGEEERRERSGRTTNTNEFVLKAKLTGSAGRSSRGESPVTSRAAASRSAADR